MPRDDVPRNDRPLPANTEAEQALLGAILVNNAAYGRVAEVLAPEQFGIPVHGRIFAAICEMIERGQVANPVTLKNLFDQDGALADIGGAQYLARLADSAGTIINAQHYGRTIRDLHLRRELIASGRAVIEDAFLGELDRDASAIADAWTRRLSEFQGYDGAALDFTVASNLAGVALPERPWLVE